MEENKNEQATAAEGEAVEQEQQAAVPLATESAEAPEAAAESDAAVAEAPAAAVAGHQVRVNNGLINTTVSELVGANSWPDFSIGDTIKVHYKIVEGEKQRIQVYEGTVISMRGDGMGKSFTVRRISHDVGVERIFPYHSPQIADIEVTRRGKVRRAKLYYLREKRGKGARIKEDFEGQIALNAERKKERQKKAAKKSS